MAPDFFTTVPSPPNNLKNKTDSRSEYCTHSFRFGDEKQDGPSSTSLLFGLSTAGLVLTHDEFGWHFEVLPLSQHF